ncbi:NADP-dependent oxidoreductase domain-containing protein [Alternaria rosae]|uniref:NADP-dependent oxidoreductase domain-containing protein n=1 Tax=Alternaria rosae TaxID=1187941 RepID=UPI001E8D1D9B|nr:NADP-dependent oxidoreductase domain-containing protein [Alternaria rosae]KAH6876067.1 NADP-dependent oxidoreductase domain-containing protein [Alternaria rosae]
MSQSEAPKDLPEMEYRFVGKSGLQISAISLGGWLTYGGHVGDDNTFACLKAAFDAGINFFDCAEGYAKGESEKVMGRAIKHFNWNRNDIVVSTKIYWGTHNSALPSPRNKINNLGLSRKHLIEATEASLERLQLSYVDILYAHRPDRYTPIEETVRAFNYLINTGKTFYWGTSEWLASEIEEAWAVADRLGLIGPVVEQPGYSLLRPQKVDQEYKDAGLYTRRGLGLTIFSPLQGGLLTGKYVDGVPEDSRLRVSDDPYIQSVMKGVGSDAWNEQQGKIKKLMDIAKKLDTDVATLSMAWVLSNKNVSSAITGASRPDQIYQTVKAVDVYRKLTKENLEEIEEVMGSKPEALTMRFG